MAKTLTRTVYVDGVAYGPASAIPEDVAKRITNPKVWADADAPAPAPAGVVPATIAERPADEPPSAEWTVRELKDFAKAEGIALGDARAKDQILAVLADAGHAGPEGDDEGEDATDAEVPEADSPEDVDEHPADD